MDVANASWGYSTAYQDISFLRGHHRRPPFRTTSQMAAADWGSTLSSRLEMPAHQAITSTTTITRMIPMHHGGFHGCDPATHRFQQPRCGPARGGAGLWEATDDRLVPPDIRVAIIPTMSGTSYAATNRIRIIALMFSKIKTWVIAYVRKSWRTRRKRTDPTNAAAGQ